MASLLKSLQKITICYNDPDATDSDSDVGDLGNLKRNIMKRKEIVIWHDISTQNPVPVFGNGGEAPKNDNQNQRVQKRQKTQKVQQKKLQKEPVSKFHGVRKEECGSFGQVDTQKGKRSQKLLQESASKFPGVRRRDWGKFAAEIRNPFDKKRMWLGTFDSEEKAAKAYQSKKAEFEMIIANMNKNSDENNVSHSTSVPGVGIINNMATPNSMQVVTKIASPKLLDASIQLEKSLPQIPEMDGEEEFDLKKFQDLMYSWYVEKGSELVSSANIINPVDRDLGAWQPSKKVKLDNYESRTSSPPLSPILDFEHMQNGNDLKALGFDEVLAPSCCREDDDISELFELENFPMLFPDQEHEEHNWKQLCDELFVDGYQFSN